jgi:hypothetical protein
MTALLVGLGGQHTGAPRLAATLDPATQPGSVPQLTLTPGHSGSDSVPPLAVGAQPAVGGRSSTTVTHPTPTTTVTTVTTVVTHPTPTTTPTTVVTHPTPTSTVTTVVTHPTPTTTVTTTTLEALARPASPTTTTTPAVAAPVSTGTLLEGSYDGAADPANIAAFDATTGTHSEIASDYLPSDSGWTGMDGAGGSLAWLTNAWEGKGYTLSLGVPIIPTNAAGVAQGSLAAGATGAYNSYFVTLAQTLVAAGEGNTYLRLGWEFDGNWYPSWDADSATAETQYAAYFDQIVTAMRSVAGEKFQFVWNPDGSAFIQSGYNVALAYPGNAYVNVIGLDLYDQSWLSPLTPTNAWDNTTQPALNAAHAFAAAQGKPLAFCEWGIVTDGAGLGDDPLYVNNMAAFMKNPANDVAYESYFNFHGTGDSILTGGGTPNSLAAFRAAMG